jgi:alpha-glucosidase
MVADYPSAYRGHPALPVLARIPTTWDDTKVLDGAVGQFIVIARRQSRQWWVGAMTDREGRTLKIPLSFLGPGQYQAELYRDDPSSSRRLERVTRNVAAQDVLTVDLAAAGGLLIHVSPATLEP